MRTIVFAVLQSVVLLTTAALADVPGLINYQGTLTDSSGVALDTTVSMTFSIYSDSTGLSSVWAEVQPAVEVSDGIFNVLLGSVYPISEAEFPGPARWLGIQVGGDSELAPLQKLVSVPYAFRAAEAETADYALSAPAASDGDWTISGSDMYAGVSGNIGIGTSSPAFHLDIQDSYPFVRIKASAGNTGLVIDKLTVGDFGHIMYRTGGSDRWATGLAGDDNYRFRYWPTTTDVMYLQATGEVGIGTTSPAAKLHVNGTLNVGMNSTGYAVNFYGAESGSRLFWDEAKMAFHAGRDSDGTHWASDSTGNYSFATGRDTKASGLNATAMGYLTTASGDYSTALGRQTEASGLYSTAMGYSTTASGDWGATAMGYSTTASGDQGATAMGISTTASRKSATAMGAYTTASGDYAAAIGLFVAAESTNAIVLGRGIDVNNPLVNNITNSLMVGFNDTTATLFVGGANHRVGVRTDSPTAKLDVEGDTGYDQIRMRTSYTPTDSTDANGNVGDIAWDESYVYIKTSGGWKRAALSTF
jgi:hypothetical protein